MILSLNHSRTGRDLVRAEWKLLSATPNTLRHAILLNYIMPPQGALERHYAMKGRHK